MPGCHSQAAQLRGSPRCEVKRAKCCQPCRIADAQTHKLAFMQTRVLQVGGDEVLLETRGAILRYLGLSVESCYVTSRPGSVDACLERYFDSYSHTLKQPFDAIIMCHTLDEERASVIAQEVRRVAPMKIIILESLDGPQLPSSLYDIAVSSKYGPSALVHTVTTLFADAVEPEMPAAKTSPFPTNHASAVRPLRALSRRSPPAK